MYKVSTTLRDVLRYARRLELPFPPSPHSSTVAILVPGTTCVRLTTLFLSSARATSSERLPYMPYPSLYSDGVREPPLRCEMGLPVRASVGEPRVRDRNEQ